MLEHAVECPSGLQVTVRAYKVRDEDLLADAQTVRKGLATTRLLEAVTLNLDDPGPYQFKDGKLDWNQVLQGDRMVTVLRNRVTTWPISEYPYDYGEPCPRCRQPVSQSFNLDELPIRPLPEASKRHVRDGEPLEAVLPACGVRVGFRLLRGKDDKALSKLRESDGGRLSSGYIRLRLLSVEGVKEPQWGEWIRDLGGHDAAYLRSAFDANDCGIDTTAELLCQCGHAWETELRFDGGFLFPRYRGKKTDASAPSIS